MSKKSLYIYSLLTALFLAGGYWFWSLGSVKAASEPAIVVKVERGGVQIKTTDAGDWQTWETNAEVPDLQGIRTDGSGRASVRFFGLGETRLQENSDLQILNAMQSADDPSIISVRLKLASGRAWSRILRLFDLDSSFIVETNDVIATVRGTAFDIKTDETGTQMQVAEAAVDIEPKDNNNPSLAGRSPLPVPEGYKIIRERNGTWLPMALLNTKDTAEEWFLNNVKVDEAFEQEVIKNLEARLEKSGAAGRASPLGGLTTLSERLHLAIAGKKSAALRGVYFERRLFALKTMAEQGKSGLALQSFSKLEQSIKNEMKSERGKKALPFLRLGGMQVSLLLSDIDPDSISYRIKQRLEDLNQSMIEDNMDALLYARLLSVDTRLNEAANLIVKNDLEAASFALEAASQGLQNNERDLEKRGDGKDVHSGILRSKLASLKTRTQAVAKRLEAAVQNPSEQVESIESTDALQTVESSSASILNENVTSTLIEEQSPLISIKLTALPNPVVAGQAAVLRVIGQRADGSVVDLTPRAYFSLKGNAGSLDGATYYSAVAGLVTLEATVSDYGVVKTDSVVLETKEAVKLVGIEIMPQGRTTVEAGSQVPLTVTARYSNNQSKIITDKVIWSTSDKNIGSAANGMFTAWIAGQGQVIITAAYTEEGATKTASIAFTVTD